MQCRLPQFARGMALWRSSGYIGGKWKDCDAKFAVYNPATGQELGRVADMGRKDAEEAVQEAYDAFKVWKNVTTKVCHDKINSLCGVEGAAVQVELINCWSIKNPRS